MKFIFAVALCLCLSQTSAMYQQLTSVELDIYDITGDDDEFCYFKKLEIDAYFYLDETDDQDECTGFDSRDLLSDVCSEF